MTTKTNEDAKTDDAKKQYDPKDNFIEFLIAIGHRGMDDD